MLDNLIICWSLLEREAEDQIQKAVADLGGGLKVMPSVWYVASRYAAGDAAEHIRSAMPPDSALLLVNASADELGWFNLEQGARLQQTWDQVACREGRT
jgi:hypothetical protein